MHRIKVKGQTLILTTQNWEDLRVYLRLKIPTKRVEELGYLGVGDDTDDDLSLRNVPDEVASFIDENREQIIEEAEY